MVSNSPCPLTSCLSDCLHAQVEFHAYCSGSCLVGFPTPCRTVAIAVRELSRSPIADITVENVDLSFVSLAVLIGL